MRTEPELLLGLGRVLVIDDEESMCRYLELLLESEGYAVEWSVTSGDAIDRHDRFQPDAVLVDLGLADGSGTAVCEALRRHCDTPILIVSGSDCERDIVAGLHAGADGYLVKPVRPMELIARIRAVMRRPDMPDIDVSDGRVGPIEVERGLGLASLDGKTLDLLPREFAILDELVKDAGKRVTRRSSLLRPHEDPAIVDGLVRRLRAVLEAAEGWRRLVTVRGVGFRLMLERDEVLGLDETTRDGRQESLGGRHHGYVS